jgi:TolA-binding protein
MTDEAKLETLLDEVSADVAREGVALEGDEAVVARSIDAALARAAAENQARAPVARLATRKRFARVLLLAAAIVVVATAAIAMLGRTRRAQHASEGPSLGTNDVAQNTPATLPQPSPPSTPTPTPTATATPTSIATTTSNTNSTTTPPSTSPSTSTPAEPTASASELFAQANDARRRGDVAAAVKKYRDLQQRYPASPEASMSRLALGRLYLDRTGDAAGALAQFDAYLAAGGGGPLREEALVGRALALGRLGRAAEEKKAWEALLVAYPSSLSADRARERLSQLK